MPITLFKKLSLLAPPIFFIYGCASGPVQTTNLESSDYAGTVKILDVQTSSCWTNSVTPVKKGIRVQHTNSDPFTETISGYRVEWAGPPPKEPFISVNVKNMDGKAKIEISEHDFTCGIGHGCVNLNLRDDIPKWLNGDTSCRNISKILISLGLGF